MNTVAPNQAKKIIFGALISYLWLGTVLALPVQAQTPGVTITPTVIDERVSIRDIIERTVKIKNNTQARAEIYAFVNDIKETGGIQEFNDPTELDNNNSLARWVEIKRGVIAIMPGEEAEVPLKITVNPNAKPGKYYAVITFANSFNRDAAAGAVGSGNQPELMVNLEIAEHIIERAEKTVFSTEREINLKRFVNFIINIKNIGNRPVSPVGSVIIYDRNEREVSNLDVSEQLKDIAPSGQVEFRQTWDSGSRFGRFKAKLELEYGDSEMRDLQDSIFFWVLPWWLIVIALTILTLLLTNIFYLVYKLKKHSLANHPTEPRSPVINIKDKKQF